MRKEESPKDRGEPMRAEESHAGDVEELPEGGGGPRGSCEPLRVKKSPKDRGGMSAFPLRGPMDSGDMSAYPLRGGPMDRARLNLT